MIKVIGRLPSIFPLWDPWEIDESFNALLTESTRTWRLAVFIDGLDEFEVHPKEVVRLVESITSKCSAANHPPAAAPSVRIKMCVASRPWIEFDDAYREIPQLAMDLLTADDMQTFVAEGIRDCRAFDELRRIYPLETDRLLNNMTCKANGVFVWLKVVTQALVESATEGAGIFELQGILESLPTDMCLLYDAIWARMPLQTRTRGAVLLQMVRAASEYWSPSWALIWLAEEYAWRPVGIGIDDKTHLKHLADLSSDSLQAAKTSLRRKLTSRTRGLLELVDTKTHHESHGRFLAEQGIVAFHHRTANEWVTQPAAWQAVSSACPADFDPYMCILNAYTLQMRSASLAVTAWQSIWRDIGRALWSASLVRTAMQPMPDRKGRMRSYGLLTTSISHVVSIFAPRCESKIWHWSTQKPFIGRPPMCPSRFRAMHITMARLSFRSKTANRTRSSAWPPASASSPTSMPKLARTPAWLSNGAPLVPSASSRPPYSPPPTFVSQWPEAAIMKRADTGTPCLRLRLSPNVAPQAWCPMSMMLDTMRSGCR